MAKKKTYQESDRSLESEYDDSPSMAVAEAESTIYAPDYKGRKWWLLGIRVDEERGMVPFHNAPFGGVPWQQGTQNQVEVEPGWIGLDSKRARLTPQLLRSDQVVRCVSEIKQKVVRWRRRQRDAAHGTTFRWAAQVLSLEHRIKTYDKKNEEFVPSGYRYEPGDNDVPVSSYLIFVRRSRLQELVGGSSGFSQPELTKIPTMLELDPGLIPDRMSGKREDFEAGDEPW